MTQNSRALAGRVPGRSPLWQPGKAAIRLPWSYSQRRNHAAVHHNVRGGSNRGARVGGGRGRRQAGHRRLPTGQRLRRFRAALERHARAAVPVYARRGRSGRRGTALGQDHRDDLQLQRSYEGGTVLPLDPDRLELRHRRAGDSGTTHVVLRGQSIVFHTSGIRIEDWTDVDFETIFPTLLFQGGPADTFDDEAWNRLCSVLR